MSVMSSHRHNLDMFAVGAARKAASSAVPEFMRLKTRGTNKRQYRRKLRPAIKSLIQVKGNGRNRKEA
jgi:hypothetical protein